MPQGSVGSCLPMAMNENSTLVAMRACVHTWAINKTGQGCMLFSVCYSVWCMPKHGREQQGGKNVRHAGMLSQWHDGPAI